MTIARFKIGYGEFCSAIPALLWELNTDELDGRPSNKYRLVFSDRKPPSMRGVYRYTFSDYYRSNLSVTDKLSREVQAAVSLYNGRPDYNGVNGFYIMTSGRRALSKANLWGKSGYVWVEEA